MIFAFFTIYSTDSASSMTLISIRPPCIVKELEQLMADLDERKVGQLFRIFESTLADQSLNVYNSR